MEKVTLFLLLAIAINGIALYYQQIQRPGHILHWWYKVWSKWVPFAYDMIKQVISLWFEAPTEEEFENSRWWEWILYTLSLLILIIGLVVVWVFYKLRKPIATCIHCNIFWVSLISYLMIFNFDVHLITFFGTVYVILLSLLSLPYLKGKFE